MNKNLSRQSHFTKWIMETLAKAENKTMGRQRLWNLYKVSDAFAIGDTSAGLSVGLKTLLSNGQIEVVFLGGVKHVRAK